MNLSVLCDRNFSICYCYNIKGSRPEWCISIIYHAWDTPFWSGTLDIFYQFSVTLAMITDSNSFAFIPARSTHSPLLGPSLFFPPLPYLLFRSFLSFSPSLSFAEKMNARGLATTFSCHLKFEWPWAWLNSHKISRSQNWFGSFTHTVWNRSAWNLTECWSSSAWTLWYHSLKFSSVHFTSMGLE